LTAFSTTRYSIPYWWNYFSL